MEKNQMFCYQCQETANGFGCTISGVCGKNAKTAALQDELTCEMISLAAVMQVKKTRLESEDNVNALELIDLIVEGLYSCVTNVNFDGDEIKNMITEIKEKREKLGGRELTAQKDIFLDSSCDLLLKNEDVHSLRSTFLFGMRGMAAFAHHARILRKREIDVDFWFIKGMAALSSEYSIDEWLDLLAELGIVNFKCLKMLDAANTDAFGNPEPAKVSLKIEKGSFIVVSGHDLRDIKLLLEQTEEKGVNVYTHGEMLPAHAYPGIKKYRHLKGHFGTAWQNQQAEFTNIPAPVLFTANCLMPPKKNYSDNIYTTSVVRFPGLKHIESFSNNKKDFTPLIEHAIKLGGYDFDIHQTGMNGGSLMTTGYGRKAIIDNITLITNAVKAGEIKHIFLIGGCDGARYERRYFTEFVKQTPNDTIVLILACGKFRFNDIDAGLIRSCPRILDMGQCNDAYGAVAAAVALAVNLDCFVNELPLTIILSWYEQKAVSVLLTLLSLGLKNIYIGPSVPAFFSKTVMDILTEKYEIKLISTPEDDLERIFKK